MTCNDISSRHCHLPGGSHLPFIILSVLILDVSLQYISMIAGFSPEIKSTGTNGPLSLKKVGHFRKCGAQYDANSLSAFRQVGKTWELLNYS